MNFKFKKVRLMENILDSIADFIGKLVSVSVVGGILLVTAGEVKLAALRKVSQGSTKLSNFTARMTKPVTDKRGDLHEAGKKSHSDL